MSVTYGFYNSIDGDRRYNAEQMSAIFDGLISPGVFATLDKALVVAVAGGMNVKVGAGKAWFNSTWTNNDADLPFTIEPAEILLKRIDSVVLEINFTENVRANTFKVIKGVPSSVPVAPTLIRTTLVNQYPLANVFLAPSVTEVTPTDITNLVGTSACPFITGVIETINIDILLEQWRGEFQDWFDSFADILDENTAANLLNMINHKQDIIPYTTENVAHKGQANGYAALGADGKVPAEQMGGEPIFANKITYIYAGSDLTQVDENYTASTVLFRRTNYTYSGGNVASVRTRNYATNGVTVVKDYTDTYTYTNGLLTLAERTVAV